MTDTFHILVGDTFTMIHNGKSYAATSSHPKWKKMLKALAAKKFDKVVKLCDSTDAVRKQITTEGLDERLRIHGNGTVEYDGVRQGDQAAEYIHRMIDANMSLRPVVNFLQLLSNNPSYHSREEGLEFVVTNELPITEDGRFMAYKRINADWTDAYSHTISNEVGEHVSMPRHDVDDNSSRTCSRGLHVCSKEYLTSYYGERLIAVVVDPADVVSVPHDYNGSKMRVCAYEVATELPMDLIVSGEDAWKAPVVDDAFDDMEGREEEDDEEDDEGITGFIALHEGWTSDDVQDAALFSTQKQAVKELSGFEWEIWLANECKDGIDLLYQMQ